MRDAAEQRGLLLDLLGDPAPAGMPGAQVLNVREQDGYVLETLLLRLNGLESVPAYVARPANQAGPLPLVLFNHSHGGNFAMGKRELVQSSEYLQTPSFAKTLTGMGYMAACIDMWSFGERRGKPETEQVKECLLYGRTLWGMRIFDSLAFLDYLCARPDVDAARVGTIGMSMGGLMAWWLAALDERVQACVDIAGQVDAETLIEQRGLDGHGFYYYVPGLLKHFTTGEIQALIAPRARLSLTGRDDKQCPARGVAKLDKHLRAAYAAQGRPEGWQSISTAGGHLETAEMRWHWQEFLRKHL